MAVPKIGPSRDHLLRRVPRMQKLDDKTHCFL